MSGIGGIVRWDDRPVELAQIEHMMHLVSHRGPDKIHCEVKDRVGLGHALLAIKKSDPQYSNPVWLPDASLGIVADASIYNRNDLLNRLGNVSWWQGRPSDAAIILAAYQRWGEELLRNLDGDFAFAIWDRRCAQLFAARDPFGARPLFFFHDKNRFLFGSEPKQLLAMPDVPVKPFDETIGEFLLWNFKQLDKTFFEDIRRLKPAHYLVATSDGVVQKRWWDPDPENEIFYKDPQEYFDQFRDLLKAAVAKRLQTNYPVGAHLSGGFDSPSIVVLAEEIYRQSNGSLAPLETISAVYGDLPCDESYYIEAVTSQVSFPSNTFSPLDEAFHIEHVEEQVWQLDSPLADVQPAFFNGCARIMSQLDARLLLDGLGGDEVAQHSYDVRDLPALRRVRALLRDSWYSEEDTNRSISRLIRTTFTQVVPESIKRQYRQIQSRKKPSTPDWLTADFADRLRNHSSAPERPLPRYRSQTQNAILHVLSRPVLHWGLETLELKGSYNAFEHRRPYCDRPLVEFMLAIPIEQRLKLERWRHLHRRGLVAYLPEKILRRRDQTYFTSYFVRILAEVKPKLQDFLFSSAALECAPYVHRERAERLFRDFSLTDAESDTRSAQALWQIAYLELWLRQLSRYNRAKIAHE